VNIDTLAAELTRDEGKRLKPYKDSVGKLTIGVGRNLDDVGIRPDECDLLLKNDILAAMNQLDINLAWWRNLDEVRQRVLANMAFNMGIATLLTFKNTLAAVEAGSWEAAADGMKASHWAAQVGPRADRLIAMMRTGVAP
jgi:lysozyme